MNDSDLLRQFRRGDEEAFSQLVRKYARPLTMMILKLVGNQEDAKDISQTVFLKAYEALPTFLGASSFKTWLYKIAVNKVLDHVRKNRPPITDAIEELRDPKALPDERLDLARSRQQLRSALDTLPEKQRLPLQLRVYEEMNYLEIARILGGTAGGARGNFFQATKALRAKLGQSRANRPVTPTDEEPDMDSEENGKI